MALLPMSTLLKLLLIYVYSLSSAAYVWALVRKAKLGLPRLAVALPVILGNLAIPLLLEPSQEALLITPTAGVLSLAAFKILAYCLGRGPLILDFSVYQFMAVLLLPIIPHEAFFVSGGKRIPEQKGGAKRDSWQLLQDYGKQIGCATVVAFILVAFPDLHWFPRHWLYTLSSCMFLGGLFDALGIIATALFNVSVAPTFNRPWMCDTFADFWSRRWNLTTTYMMRVLVYEPVMEGKWVATPYTPPPAAEATTSGSQNGSAQDGSAQQDKPAGLVQRKGAAQDSSSVAAAPAGPEPVAEKEPKKRSKGVLVKRFLALQATFMFSGVWHILVFWCNTRVISLRWAMFFIIQAPIVLCESLLSKAWRKAGLPRLPHPVQIVLTNAALIAIAGPLFFGPADETGFAQRNLAAIKPVVDFMKSYIGHAWYGAGHAHVLSNGTSAAALMNQTMAGVALENDSLLGSAGRSLTGGLFGSGQPMTDCALNGDEPHCMVAAA